MHEHCFFEMGVHIFLNAVLKEKLKTYLSCSSEVLRMNAVPPEVCYVQGQSPSGKLQTASRPLSIYHQ